jgi:rhamnogalacturonyl hydrolase YesR
MYYKVCESLRKLTAYCSTEEFKGYDPYDGLTSPFFKSLPLISKNRLARLIWIQSFKKSPLNLRPLFGIRKDYNPKALALFLSGYVSLYKMNRGKEYLDKIVYFSDKILEDSSPGYSGQCWGYNFDWESRAFFLPKYTPTIVVSSFVACALLDAFEITSDERLLKAARSTCDFILTDLNRTYDDKGNFVFSYSKFDNSSVFNASLMGSRLLARVYSITGESHLKEEAKKSVKYVCNHQNLDGSWPYGKLPFHQWIDSFHTGFNLECISDYTQYSSDLSFSNNIEKGFNYYVNTFFTPEGVSKYYNTAIYPVDVHAPAQLVITICKLGKLRDSRELIQNVLDWTIENMQSDEGFFYYQIRKHFKIRISYMRWSQAWMFYAMSVYLLQEKVIAMDS